MPLTLCLCVFVVNLFSVAAHAADRVVSLNLCTDQMLVLLAPEKVAALSPLARDPALSFVAPQAEHLPVVRASAEAVLRLHPDLVLAAPYGAQTTLALLQQERRPAAAHRPAAGFRRHPPDDPCARRPRSACRNVARRCSPTMDAALAALPHPPRATRPGLGAARLHRGTRHADGRGAARRRNDQCLGRPARRPGGAAAASARPAGGASRTRLSLARHRRCWTIRRSPACPAARSRRH